MSNFDIKKYSIIIPHHNIPKLLRRLLCSIPQREDIEVIVIDDNSDKEFLPDLYDLEKEYSNAQFVFLDKCRGGGGARNVGLEYAKGKWIIFADSDDFFNYCINDILDEYKSCNADIIFFNANSLYSNLYTTANRAKHLNYWIDNYNKTGNELMLRYLFGEPWCKFVKRKIIFDNNIRFEETTIHNDTAYSYLVGYYSKKMVVDSRALYCVTSRENSVSKGVSLEKKIERIGVFSRSSLFFKTHLIPIKEYRHFNQLLDLRLKNKKSYSQAIELMKKLGYTSTNIKIGLVKQLIVRLTKIPIRLVVLILQKTCIHKQLFKLFIHI